MKKVFLKSLSIIFLMISDVLPLPAQGISEGLISNPAPVFAEPSPNAGAFQNVNVDLFHGNCNISIPLYRFQGPQLNIPVSLNYTAPKADQEVYHPGWTGWGWNLSPGGCITRTVRGKPDETATSGGHYVWPISSLDCDPHEDIFCFNMGGHSGRFFFHPKTLSWKTITSSEIIFIHPKLGSSNKIMGFTLQMQDGTIYTFGGIDDAIEYSAPLDNRTQTLATSWMLTQISSPTKATIDFNYERGASICSLTEPRRSSITAIYSETKDGLKREEVYTSTSTDLNTGTFIRPSYLKSIFFPLGDVLIEFDRSVSNEKRYKGPQYALPPDSLSMNWYKLDAIRLIDWRTDKCFKKYRLAYGEGDMSPLILNSVQEIGIDLNNRELSNSPYHFSYLQLNNGGIEHGNWNVLLLEKLTYPTGGFTTFEFENNRISKEKLTYPIEDFIPFKFKNNRITQDEELTPGFRILSIKSYASPDDGAPREKKYTYELYFADRSPESSGELSRHKITKYDISFPAFYGSVRFTKSANYDMTQYNAAACPPYEQTCYSAVTVHEKKGGETIDINEYTFNNYPGALNGNGQRSYSYYGPVGQLLSEKNSRRRIEYEYAAYGAPDWITQAPVEYFPFKYKGNIYSYRLTNYISADYTKRRLVKIKEYNISSTLITTLTYNNVTGCVTTKETKSQEDGNTYTTEYRYQYTNMQDIVHDRARRINVPHEIVYKKNGKIIGGETTQFISDGGGDKAYLPVKKYKLVLSEPLEESAYSYASLGAYIMDARYQPETEYEYDADGRVTFIKHTGQEPLFFEWGDYNKIVRKSVGNMHTDYTNNIHGVTSITDVNGIIQTIEYNALGQPIQVKDHEGNILKSMKYDTNINP